MVNHSWSGWRSCTAPSLARVDCFTILSELLGVETLVSDLMFKMQILMMMKGAMSQMEMVIIAFTSVLRMITIVNNL